MICRLCLINLNAENAIALFEASGNYSETQILKMIAKHFHLELSRDDPVSTSICQDCSEHLEDFHRFWKYVDQKQSTLRNEFLEVKCEVNILSEGNEESLLDLENISMEFADVALVEENKIDANTVEDMDTASIAAIDDIASDSVDENTASLMLISRSKTKKGNKTKVSKRATRSKPVSKVKLQDVTDKEVIKSESNARKSLKKEYDETIADFMKLSCDICNLPVDSFKELRKHFQTLHQSPAYVKCCRRSFNHPSVLVDHIKWHRNPDVYKCDICDKCLKSVISLQKHKELHLTNNELKSTSDKAHNCEICSQSFITAQRLRLHNSALHKKFSENDKDNNCEICNKRFITAKRLRLHISCIHTNVSHICDTCGIKFKHKRAFKKHILEHQGIVEPPAQCKQCGEWLKNKKTLSRHRLKHDQVHVDCHICGRKCPSKKALNGHMDYMHKRQKNLQCNYCEKSFKLPHCLEEHVAMHTGALLYTCPHCSKEFRSKSNMYVHIKRVHMEEWLQSKVARSNDPSLKSRLD